MGKNKSATKKLLKLLGILLFAMVVLAIVAKTAGWLDGDSGEVEVETQQAELRTITQLVSASGRIQPEVEVIIRPDVSGEIIELNVKEGDFVREGELLLRIKPDIYEARIDELNAALLTQQSRMEQARATMLQAEAEFMKNQQLYDRELISELEFLQIKNNYEAQKANLKAAEFQIESARAQLRRAEEELQQTVIRSPKDGTISRLAVERGERVLGQAQTAGTEMMRIARMEQMEVVVDVNENDIVNVSLTDTTLIEVDAYPNRTFEGVVTEIANSADVTGSGSADQVTNYKVKIRITTPHNLDQSPDRILAQDATDSEVPEFIPNFKPGMSGTVDIKANTVYDVVSVPIQAVTVRNFAEDKQESDEDGETSGVRSRSTDEDFRRVVFVNDNGIAKRVEVETGISDNTHIQIMSGVDTGAEVVTGSYRILSRVLNDGNPIKVQNRNKIAALGGN
ncbi:efflux RND transporter periplasmic adaptor subunit [Rhodohalobacter halophilus]|uniref:efflux RND transporter periplasmic adaptor subunit n=1 Tax=Rhodohalobacter halophilus TaxID=1812810 RepID=UPI00083F5E69|nr:efflux RND transporter periplasmic adaptor subunit [Rhodohalobacter halophilus]